jgi:hypothetical protein
VGVVADATRLHAAHLAHDALEGHDQHGVRAARQIGAQRRQAAVLADLDVVQPEDVGQRRTAIADDRGVALEAVLEQDALAVPADALVLQVAARPDAQIRAVAAGVRLVAIRAEDDARRLLEELADGGARVRQ